MAPIRSSLWLLAIATALVAACSTPTDPNGTNNNTGDTSGTDDTGGTTPVNCTAGGSFGVECKPAIEVREAANGSNVPPGKVFVVTAGDMSTDDEYDYVLKVGNTGNAGLTITKIVLNYSAPVPNEPVAGFRCLAPDGTTACKDYAWPVVNPTKNVLVKVRFKKLDDKNRSATLVISSNDAFNKSQYQVTFSTSSGQPKVKVQPAEVDFGFVAIGADKIASAKVYNTGNAELVVNEMDLSEPNFEKDLFTVILEGKEYAAGALVTLDPPLTVAAGMSTEIKIKYVGKDDKPHPTAIVLHTNDPTLTVASDGGPGFKRIPVKVNSTGPCLLVLPKVVVFGATGLGDSPKRPVQLKSCGDIPVEISNIAFAAGGSDEFEIDWTSIGQAPTEKAPLVIPVNGSATLQVIYSPADQSPVKDGAPVLDKATVDMKTNTASGKATAQLEGFGSATKCPTAIIIVQEGDTVTPQTLLHLDGKQSYSTGGTISKYKWEVEQPKGSVGLFLPNDSASGVQFTPNVAGDYKFKLHVQDQSGVQSCFPAEKIVKVLPDQAIHVELLWDTPGDLDQTNEGPGAGSDLDLHFAHQYAAGQDFDQDGKADPWFADTYDCFWFNRNPEWGSHDPNIDDNPSLDRDDTDGAGPENLNLTLPEDGKIYSVGVHYYNHFGKGPSFATVRIYVYGDLVYEKTSPSLNNKDMWYVATIDWPTGDVVSKKDKSNKPFITPSYPHPEL
ncbi:MAG: YfaP family protein [Myxococcota bacterium]